jgi:acetamidase/formamidase
MDLPCVTNGCRLYFPVKVPGALLHIGDAHALQGEGEISGVAVEMPAEVTLKVDLIKNRTIDWPRIENNEYIMGVGCTGVGRTLEDAIRLGYVNLTLWMEEYGISRWDAWELCSFLGKVTLGNIWCVAAGFPKKYLR